MENFILVMCVCLACILICLGIVCILIGKEILRTRMKEMSTVISILSGESKDKYLKLPNAITFIGKIIVISSIIVCIIALIVFLI